MFWMHWALKIGRWLSIIKQMWGRNHNYLNYFRSADASTV
jgi:hypothetical protein